MVADGAGSVFAAYFALRTDRTAMNRLCGSVIFPAMRQAARPVRRVRRLRGRGADIDGDLGGHHLAGLHGAAAHRGTAAARGAGGFRADRRLPDVDGVRRLLPPVGTAYSTDSFQDRSGIVAQPCQWRSWSR